jgi:hypothetical protein
MGISETILWTLFVIETAMMEAAMFHQIVPNRNPSIDEHYFLQMIRITVYFAVFGATRKALLFLLPLGLMFPFIHDGVYYSMRHQFNTLIYPKKWREQGTTTDVKFSFSYNTRFVLFLIGIVLWTLSLYTESLLSK